MSKKLVKYNKDTNKLTIYVNDSTINNDNWLCDISRYILNFLESNLTGICHIKLDYKYIKHMKRLIDHIDSWFPKKLYVSFN